MSTPTEPKSKTTRLLELIEHENPEIFHTETGEPFARVKVENHFENLGIEGEGFSGWLNWLTWQAAKEAVNGQALEAVRRVLYSKARFDGPEHRLYNRVAWHNGAIWYDLADRHWQAQGDAGRLAT